MPIIWQPLEWRYRSLHLLIWKFTRRDLSQTKPTNQSIDLLLEQELTVIAGSIRSTQGNSGHAGMLMDDANYMAAFGVAVPFIAPVNLEIYLAGPFPNETDKSKHWPSSGTGTHCNRSEHSIHARQQRTRRNANGWCRLYGGLWSGGTLHCTC